MSTILVTGANGVIAHELCERIARSHRVVRIGRSLDPDVGHDRYRCDFSLFEDLRQLDDIPFDAVVHLAAVTGGCSERDGMLVNVEGTRRLMRYLIDRGCRKLVMASSIAVVGMQNPDFRPISVPIADQHPCLDRDAYGFSKHLMEEVTRYYSYKKSTASQSGSWSFARQRRVTRHPMLPPAETIVFAFLIRDEEVRTALHAHVPLPDPSCGVAPAVGAHEACAKRISPATVRHTSFTCRLADARARPHRLRGPLRERRGACTVRSRLRSNRSPAPQARPTYRAVRCTAPELFRCGLTATAANCPSRSVDSTRHLCSNDSD